ncbi:flagellar hook-length control protein FliK [Campylobacter novaezeelandiae]|uniref:flagellar hook-length control protein FliK n=1 Tax=Campylobacter novaezeelandiae TaxID=2267891 RepID=UPI001904DC79|nr:flagellar hook-length control protein FliK [Campylobacter novaezeelandiae]MBK1964219.1 flagellar hook-length control protein FliK [Campylobacter novaezeelandiae]MBK1993034.1 flagellar hook-length control protein FliK [Campylobacter novaezeelandiae]
MINTALTNQIGTKLKNEIKPESNSKDDVLKDKLDPKNLLNKTLKQNLDKLIDSQEDIQKFIQSKTDLKFKELINKLLDQINAQKNPNSPVLKQANKLNLAPNFANELKSLIQELSKNNQFSQVLNKLENLLKPVTEIKNNDIALLFKNSGIFFEAKLKDSLNKELLPKSFYSLINGIKSLSNENIINEILELDSLNLNPKQSLEKLKNIIEKNISENKQIIQNSPFNALINLGKKITNFKNYINKNPELSQKKIITIANKILNEINTLKKDFIKDLSKPQNIAIKNPQILKQTMQSLDKLERTLKNIIEKTYHKTDNEKNTQTTTSTEKKKNQTHTKDIKLETKDLKDETIKNQENVKKEDINQKDEKKQENTKEESKTPQTKDKENDKKEIKFDKNDENKLTQKEIKNSQKIDLNTENNTHKNENLNQNIFNNLTKNENVNEQNIKNLIFLNNGKILNETEDLSKALSSFSKKIEESLKQLDPNSKNAKNILVELKNIDHKINLSMKDIQNIKPRTQNDINHDIQNDIKSTLFQVSNLAKATDNEAIFNQANRLIAQIEINQLMSLANNSINTHIPFSWDDLNDSKIIFKRGKKDKFFAQIKLEFSKLGNLEILIALNNQKYIDINIMAENQEFRKNIYENAHKLKKNINKAGLLSANFFVGDIIKSKFDIHTKNFDLNIGMDKKV